MTNLLENTSHVESGSLRSGVEVDQDLVELATALVPLIREHAQETSEARRVVPEVMTALEDADLFKLFVPHRYGGYEENMGTAVETIAEVANGDGSTAWAVALLNVCTWFASTFSERGAGRDVRRQPECEVCGIFTPGSKSKRVEGGYLVSGQWPYSSGIVRRADWAPSVSHSMSLRARIPGHSRSSRMRRGAIGRPGLWPG